MPAAAPFIKGIVDWNRKRYGITNIDPKMIGISAGVIPGIVSALQALAPKGSKVLMVTPAYVGFYAAIGFTKTVAEESPMKFVNGRYEIDWVDLERRMTPEVKVSIVCNPHNPAGRAWTREELTRYGQLCKKHNIIVLSDEIHCDFISKGQKYVPFASLDKDIVDNSITFKSGSKSFSLAAMKCAWFFSTNPKLFAATNAANFPSISNPAMVAETAAYAGGEEWLNQCVDYIDGNLDYAHQYVTKNLPLDQDRQQAGRHLSDVAGRQSAGRQDRRQEDDGRGQRQDAPPDEPLHRPAGGDDRGRHRQPLAGQERLCLHGIRFGLRQGRRELCAHERRHPARHPEGGPGQRRGGDEEPGLSRPYISARRPGRAAAPGLLHIKGLCGKRQRRPAARIKITPRAHTG